MVRRTSARPSRLPDRYSSGVPAGPTLRRVDPLHLEGLCGAISAYHTSLGGQSVYRNPLVTHFLRDALKLRPPVRSRVPPWDLAVVLEALCRPPFEPIEEISDHHLTLKDTSFWRYLLSRELGIFRPSLWPLLTWTFLNIYFYFLLNLIYIYIFSF